MNIVFLTEQGFVGKVDPLMKNMRTEYAWMNMLDAFHLPYTAVTPNGEYMGVVETADILCLIPSKSNPRIFLDTAYLLYSAKKKFFVLQEGPSDLWHDWDVQDQLVYLSVIKQMCCGVFVHNDKDHEYYQSITKKPVNVLRTVIPKYIIGSVGVGDKSKIMIGGTMCKWYGGINSYLAVRKLPVTSISIPSMGRKKANEEEVLQNLDERINYLPYTVWKDFVESLDQYRFIIHLMPTAAAGSLSLNAAARGVPCIGNSHDNTQRLLFPDLSVEPNDIAGATALAERLLNDDIFYRSVVTKALNTVERFTIEYNKDSYLGLIRSFHENTVH